MRIQECSRRRQDNDKQASTVVGNYNITSLVKSMGNHHSWRQLVPTRAKGRVSGPPNGASGGELVDGPFGIRQVPKLDGAILTGCGQFGF